MKFITLLSAILLSVTFLNAAAERKQSDAIKKPNILVILTDDHRADYLGCAGHPILKTPNIDKLAAQGSYFSNAFVTTSACTPSRTSILTGQYERKHGITFGSANSLKEEAFIDSYPVILRKAGYYTGYVGKNHTPIGWTDTLKPTSNPKEIKQRAKGGASHHHGYHSGVMEKHFDYWYGNHTHMGFYPKRRYPSYGNAKADTQPEILQEGALNFLKQNPSFTGAENFLKSRPSDKPFCLLINFNVPHSFSVNQMRQAPSDPELYRSTYRDQIDQMPLPSTYIPEADIKTPKIPKHVYNGKYLSSYDFVKTEEALRERAVRTCQTVTGVDNLVGAIIEELKAQGLYENTVIVFTSDHGLQFGEYGLGGKVLLYEPSLRVPLIISDPRVPQEQRSHKPEQLALSIDIAPTLLDLAGLPSHPEMQGCSLKPLFEKKNDVSWRKDFFAENMFMGQSYPRMEAVRTDRYKYIRYFDKKKDRKHLLSLTASINGEQPIYEELYDLQEDPEESTNLANSEVHQERMAQLRKRCQALVIEAKGSDLYPKTHQGADME